MKLKQYVIFYIGFSVVGWFNDEIFSVMRLLGSYCDEARLHNIVS